MREKCVKSVSNVCQVSSYETWEFEAISDPKTYYLIGLYLTGLFLTGLFFNRPHGPKVTHFLTILTGPLDQNISCGHQIEDFIFK